MEQSSIQLTQAFVVICASIAATCIAEGVNYYLIYRKPEYKDMSKDIESITKKLEAIKEEGVPADKKSMKKKRNSTLETRLQIMQRDLMFMKMKSTILVTIFMIATMSSLSNMFEGIAVARLPFVPFSLMQSVTHRGLVGEDLTECSYLFVYLLSGYLLRANIQKIFGFEGPATQQNMMSPWGMQYPTAPN